MSNHRIDYVVLKINDRYPSAIGSSTQPSS